MMKSCFTAEKSIYLEQFILQPDEIGCEFINAFIDRAKEGIEVSLILDWWGCRELFKSELVTKMRNAGVTVRAFHPPSHSWLWLQKGPLPRDHRKLLIIDEKSAFIGGVCMYDDIRNWRDTMVEIDGGIAAQITHIFKQTCHKIDIRNGLLDSANTVPTHPHFETHEDYSIYANAPDADEHYFSTKLIEKIENSENSIKLTTPYFTPGKDLTTAITNAAKKGIKVEIVVSAHSKYAPHVVGQLLSARFISAGVDFYYYHPQMLHLKMMIIDDNWGAIGSCNLDGLSLHQNQESMLVSTDPEFVSQISNHFKIDRDAANQYSLKDWQKRPIMDKMAARILLPFRKFL